MGDDVTMLKMVVVLGSRPAAESRPLYRPRRLPLRMLTVLVVGRIDLRQVAADLRAPLLARKDADLDGRFVATRSVRLSIIVVADRYLLHDHSFALRRVPQSHRHQVCLHYLANQTNTKFASLHLNAVYFFTRLEPVAG